MLDALPDHRPQRAGVGDSKPGATVGVYERLRADILSCALEPGSAIYEQELAQRFGVSKSPIREALLRLQEQNLVEVRARSGYRIRPVSIADANETYEMRLMYEQACVSRAIKHASDAQLEALRKHVTTEAHMDIRRWIALNRSFHSGLASIAGNSLLESASNQLNDRIDRFTFVGLGRLRQPPDFSLLNRQHAALVDAMLSRDKSAALSVLRSHIEKSRQRTLQTLASAAIVA